MGNMVRKGKRGVAWMRERKESNSKFYLIVGEGKDGVEAEEYLQETGIDVVIIRTSGIEVPYLLTPDGDYRGISVIRQLLQSTKRTGGSLERSTTY